jgi:hypothetical protein
MLHPSAAPSIVGWAAAFAAEGKVFETVRRDEACSPGYRYPFHHQGNRI